MAGLRDLAESQGVRFGCAVKTDALVQDAAYREAVAREANVLVAENVSKFGPLCPERGDYHWGPFDSIVEFAEANGQTVRGHTLVWHTQMPAWVTEANAEEALDAHVRAVVSRYRGRIESWDVVNEAIADDATPRDTLWRRALGPDYLAWAFRAAHAADSAAQLAYNDYSVEEICPKSDAMFQLAVSLLEAGVPLHAVGFQAHLELAAPPDLGLVRRNLQRFRALGLELLITELDIRIPEPFTEEMRVAQGNLYRALTEVCLEEGVSRMLTWGLTDRYSWVPGFFTGTGEALPLDAAYGKKPAYTGLAQAFSVVSRG